MANTSIHMIPLMGIVVYVAAYPVMVVVSSDIFGSMNNKTQIKTRIAAIREELENRYKYGTVKIAQADGTPVPTEDLQNEMYNLTYKLSKILTAENDGG